ncbi:MAG: DUF7901 domain-containing protein [Planctomycetota bacterium]|jgi:hypothetical protein
MKFLGLICIVGLVICRAAFGSDPQPPKGVDGLSFRADVFFPVGDDFVRSSGEPIVAVRWWGSIAEEEAPHDPVPALPFTIRFYSSAGGLPDAVLTSFNVDALETWTGGFCRGIEGLGGGDVCEGPEPLYVYEACFDPDPPFLPEPGTEYWLVIYSNINDEAHFWSWHEADVPHPTGHEAATFGFSDFVPGVINACPGDFSFLVGPYDLALELLTACPGACPWDLDGNGTIGIADLLALLAAWGTDPGGPPDFNGDGTVGISDLLELLANWGACPE